MGRKGRVRELGGGAVTAPVADGGLWQHCFQYFCETFKSPKTHSPHHGRGKPSEWLVNVTQSVKLREHGRIGL